MKRKDFLKTLGLTGIGLGASASRLLPGNKKAEGAANSDCILIPSETAGPFPLDLTDNTFYLRQDVREDRTGTQLNLKMKIIGLENCAPMQNVRVNIWHCDKDGNYSGYGSQTGTTYLRGYQMTDAEGEVEFITVYPGWYPGRVCHIHFRVYVSATYAAISQLTFDHETTNMIYNENPDEYTRGEDPLTPATDNLFSDGYDLQLADLTPNPETGGYDAYLEVTVQGNGTVGVSNIEKETAKHLQLDQNYPNPFKEETTIPFRLSSAANVKLELWSLGGERVGQLFEGKLPAGDHTLPVDLKALELPRASYLYQIEIENDSGIFKSCKMMTTHK